VPEARRLKALEDEYRRLKKRLAEPVLDVTVAEGTGGRKLSSLAARRVAAFRLMAREEQGHGR
jgi:hypothetical protein